MMIRKLLATALITAWVCAPAAAWAHGGKEKEDAGGGMSLKEMKMAAMEESPTEDYIRFDAPSGNSVVIGRKNPLAAAQPEIIKENGETIKVFRLNVVDHEFEISPGKKVQAFAFNGSVPGPTIRVTEGDRIRVILTNDTKDGHTIHIHGQIKPPDMDGVPYLDQVPVGKGESYTYEFTVQNPGTHWYHCHVDSGHHVDMGMYGAFIVDPRKQKLKFDREYTLILDEWPGGHVHMHQGEMPMAGHEEEAHGVVTEHMGTPRHDGQSEGADMGKMSGGKAPESGMHNGAGDGDMEMKDMGHMAGPAERDWYPKTYNPYTPVYDTYTINGRAFPYTEPLDVREGERVLIRIINAGYQSHFMHSHSHKFQVVALDGNPVPGKPQVRDTVTVGPGQRADILLKADHPGVWPFHCHNLLHVANGNIYPGGMLTFIRYVE